MFFVHNKFIMNQILSTKLEKSKKNPKKKNWFRFQFAFSIFIIVISICCGLSYFYHLKKEEDSSNHLIANYNIYRLYSNSGENSSQETSNGLFRNYQNPQN